MHHFFLVRAKKTGMVELVWIEREEFTPIAGEPLPKEVAELLTLSDEKEAGDESGDDETWVVSSVMDEDQALALEALWMSDHAQMDPADRVDKHRTGLFLGVIVDLVSEASSSSKI
jgi:hypothetical protein